MAKQFREIGDTLKNFIASQKIFFTGSAAPGSRVNISPRSTDHLHVLGPNEVAYLDLTGSGSETAAHVKADGALTLMLCAFDGTPMILRLYGKGRIALRGTPAYAAFLDRFYGGAEPPGARQIVCLDIDLVQTSCGFAVPLFDHVASGPFSTAGPRPRVRRGCAPTGPRRTRSASTACPRASAILDVVSMAASALPGSSGTRR